MRVLYADDDPINRKLFGTQLKKAGMDCIVVEDGQQAVDTFTGDQEFDVVVLDLHMPNLSGDDACKEIKKLNSGIPCAVVTGEAGMDDELLSIGFDRVLVKPLVGGKHISVLRELAGKI